MFYQKDECHQLDLQLADKTTPQTNDRQSYSDYSSAVREERVLLDRRTKLNDEIKWLEQTIFLLTMNSTNLATDPALQAATNYPQAKQKDRTDSKQLQSSLDIEQRH